MLPLRMVFGFGSAAMICLSLKILTIGMEVNEDVPLKGVRVKLLRCVFRVGTFFVLLFGGVIPF